jgi:hypothetical protein
MYRFSPWNADDPQRPLLDSCDASAQLKIARYRQSSVLSYTRYLSEDKDGANNHNLAILPMYEVLTTELSVYGNTHFIHALHYKLL